MRRQWVVGVPCGNSPATGVAPVALSLQAHQRRAFRPWQPRRCREHQPLLVLLGHSGRKSVIRWQALHHAENNVLASPDLTILTIASLFSASCATTAKANARNSRRIFISFSSTNGQNFGSNPPSVSFR